VAPDKLPFAPVINLKVGCRVIIKQNVSVVIFGTRPTEHIRVVNGDAGVFLGTTPGGNLAIKLDRNDETICLKKKKTEKIQYTTKIHKWVDDKGNKREDECISEKILGRFNQYPIKLAYAMTIHSAQGSTLERVHLMLGGKPFTTGLTYVALSRIKCLKNLTINRLILHSDITVAKGLTTKLNGQGELNL